MLLLHVDFFSKEMWLWLDVYLLDGKVINIQDYCQAQGPTPGPTQGQGQGQGQDMVRSGQVKL